MVAVIAVAVIVGDEAGRQRGALGNQQPLFHGEVVLEVPNLLVDFHDGVLHALRRQDAERIHRRDQIVVGLTKLPIVSSVAGRPVKLLGVNLDAQGISGDVTGHGVPGLQTVDDDHREDNGRDDRPDELETVVMREEGRLAVLVIGVFPGEVEEQAVHQNEDRGDDPDVEAHQPIEVHTVGRSRRRCVVPIGPVEVSRGSEEHDDKRQE